MFQKLKVNDPEPAAEEVPLVVAPIVPEPVNVEVPVAMETIQSSQISTSPVPPQEDAGE